MIELTRIGLSATPSDTRLDRFVAVNPTHVVEVAGATFAAGGAYSIVRLTGDRVLEVRESYDQVLAAMVHSDRCIGIMRARFHHLEEKPAEALDA